MYGDICCKEIMHMHGYYLCTPFALPLLHINQVDKFGKPTWRRLVMAVEGAAGGDNPALAETIATEHPGVPGSQSDSRLCKRTS